MAISDDNKANSFIEWFQEVAAGMAATEAATHLRKLVTTMEQEAEDQNAEVKGSISITLNLKASPSAKDGVTFDVDYTLNRKEPAPKRYGSQFWRDRGTGILTSIHPRQQNLFPEGKAEREPVRVINLKQEKN